MIFIQCVIVAGMALIGLLLRAFLSSLFAVETVTILTWIWVGLTAVFCLMLLIAGRRVDG